MASRKMGSKRAVKPAKKAAKKTVNTFFDRTRSFSLPSDEYSKNWERVFAKAGARKKKAKNALQTTKTKKKSTNKIRSDVEAFVTNLVFVGMSFQGDGMEEVFQAIRDACRSLKLTARRVDENASSGFIILEIIDLIERAEFLIFDLTFERPNVYYELGYAHGVGNAPTNILLVARDGTQLHFDIAALRVRFFKSTEDLRRIIRENLGALIKASRSS